MSGDRTALDPRPARALTSREAVKILCGLVGGMLDFSGEEELRQAVRWLAEEDDWWAFMRGARVVQQRVSDTRGSS